MGNLTGNAAFLFALACLGYSAPAWAEPRVDNVLVRMVPPGVTSLAGARMDLLKSTDLYRDMLSARKLPQFDRFAVETGFDPRRDVRELLFAESPQGAVLLARGAFPLNYPAPAGSRRIRHGEYAILALGASGFCILDATLAVSGEIPAIDAALDEWKSGTHTAARPLLARISSATDTTQVWGTSTGAAGFLADLPLATGGIDFSKVLSGLEDTWFIADFSAGLGAEVHGNAASEKDAANLRDAVRGLVGLGRLSVPERQPELVKLWDGITAEQQGRGIVVHADIPKDLVDRLVRMLGGAPSPLGRV